MLLHNATTCIMLQNKRSCCNACWDTNVCSFAAPACMTVTQTQLLHSAGAHSPALLQLFARELHHAPSAASFSPQWQPENHCTTAEFLPNDPLRGSQTERICVLHAANQTDKVYMLHAANQPNMMCALHAANQAQAQGLLRDSCHVPDQDRS